MLDKKKEHPKEKLELHPRNKHRERYNFKLLINTFPDLASFVSLNKYGDETIDFFNPEAVKMLNKSLLKHFYNIDYWDIPQHYLCPPIPGRADYIHYLADLLAENNNGIIPKGDKIKCMDIGVGANCVYPIIGNKEYNWNFVGTDIDKISIENVNTIIDKNTSLKDKIEIRLQKKPKEIFTGIINKEEKFDLTMCNPPFHASAKDAQESAVRKLSNLKNKKILKPTLNFGGNNNELWCEGGEERFIKNMIAQSKQFPNSCFWYTTLVSKSASLPFIYESLQNNNAIEVKTIQMGQGNKISRMVAWTFLTKEQQKLWINNR
jgi:23S rRNA (adenine1618-N6)-methyltransferase